jgi:SAM-dependent methyltransferase
LFSILLYIIDMDKSIRKAHWENVYQTKEFYQMGWFQNHPTVSLDLIQKLELSKNAKIIDVGGGDSYLVDYLLEMGFHDLHVLDISANAIGKVKIRLGENAENVNWLIGDIIDFEFDKGFDLWHDRAVFHFLLSKDEINQYIENVKKAIKQGGYLIIGTFSEKGPDKCSRLPITKYSLAQLESAFSPYFKVLRAFNSDHFTPNGQVQNYSFCCFERI